MNYRFQLKTKQTQESLIFLVVSVGGHELKKSTGIKIRCDWWHKGWPKELPTVSGIKVVLNEIKSRLDKLSQECYLANRPITIDYVTRHIDNVITGKIKSNAGVVEQLSLFKQEKAGKIKEGSIKTYNTLINHVAEFELTNKTTLYFEDINNKFVDRFTDFLLNDHIRIEKTDFGKKQVIRKKLQNPTVNKMLRTLKGFCTWAFENGITRSQDFKFIKEIEEADQTIIVLTPAELKLLEAYEPTSERLIRTKHCFLMGCYTGLRYEDLKQVHIDMVVDGMLQIAVTKKTWARVEIPLNPKAMDILQCYEDYRLPMYSNQKFNDYIKELCQLAGITSKVQVIEQYGNDVRPVTKYKYEAISCHDSRKTFITICLIAGINTALVMELSTHQELSSFKRYISFANDHKKEQVNNAFI